MEIHRVREFYFRPLGEDSEPGDENDGSEETGTRDDDEERLAAKTSSVTPRPRARSVWNVDGELVTHSAIHVKYEPVSFIYDYFYRLSAWLYWYFKENSVLVTHESYRVNTVIS